MTTIIRPIFEDGEDYFKSTKHRFFSLTMPIQKTETKESDYVSFFVNPLIDWFVLPPIYSIEIAIHLLNGIASFIRAAYVWSLNQQQSQLLIDRETDKELGDAVSHIDHAFSAYLAQMVNCWLSLLCLITRPIVSIVEAAKKLCQHEPQAAIYLLPPATYLLPDVVPRSLPDVVPRC